jgi:hypothetical protein
LREALRGRGVKLGEPASAEDDKNGGESMSTTKKSIVFLALAFAISWAITIGAHLAGLSRQRCIRRTDLWRR